MDHGDRALAAGGRRYFFGRPLGAVGLAIGAGLGLLAAPAWATVKTVVPMATPVAPWYYAPVLCLVTIGLPTGWLCTVVLWLRAAGRGFQGEALTQSSQPLLARLLATAGVVAVPLGLSPLAVGLEAGMIPGPGWLRWYGPVLIGIALLICMGVVSLYVMASKSLDAPGRPPEDVAVRNEETLAWVGCASGILALPLYAAGENLSYAALPRLSWFYILGGLLALVVGVSCLLMLRTARRRRGQVLTMDIRARLGLLGIATWIWITVMLALSCGC